MSRLLVLLIVLPSLAQGPLTDEELGALVPGPRRAAVREALRLAGQNALDLSDALRRVPEADRDAMAFLVAYLPQSDLASMTAEDLVEDVALAAQARDETPWAREVPYGVWLHFVLPQRSAQEPFERWRRPFHDELAPRVKGLPSLRAAALEVNRWCHENATFKETTARDQGPLTTRRRGIGRCEEEMILTIAAARSVGIPARAVFTRWWPFCDNNHAWVEVYADGGWHHLGACEPAADLDQAWFSAAASRAGMVVSVVYGLIDSPQVCRKGRSFCVLNTTSVYGPGRTGRLRLRVEKEGRPVPSKDAYACVVNFGGPRALTRLTTGEDGCAEVELGQGDYVVTAGEGSTCDHAIVTVAPGRTSEATLDMGRDRPFDAPIWLRYPKAERDAPSASSPESDAAARIAALEAANRDLMRRVAELERRAADPELVGLLETTGPWIGPFTHVLIDARGNWKAIAAAAKALDEEERKDLLDLLQGLDTKDRCEVPEDVLVNRVRHAREARAKGFAKDNELYRSYVLAPRVGDEPTTSWRSRGVGPSLRPSGEGATAVARSVNEWIAARDVREADPLGCALSPEDVVALGGGTEKDLAVAAVGLLRECGVPARLAGTWTEFHDGEEWRPLYPKDPAHLGDAKRDERTSAQYADRGTIVVEFRRGGRATTEVENGRQYALMAPRDGLWDDVDAKERKVGDHVSLDAPPGRVVLFAVVRNGGGEPYVRPFPVNVEPAKEVPLLVELDLPADEATKEKRAERKLERAPEIPGVDWGGWTVVFLYSPQEEPSTRMRPLVEAWAKDKAKWIAQPVWQGEPGVGSEHGTDVDWAGAFRVPKSLGGGVTALPAVVLIHDVEIVLWQEGYNLAIADALEGAWTRTR